MASGRLVDYLGHGNIADRPATPTLTTDAIGVWWSDDTDELSIWDGVAWHEDIGGTSPVFPYDQVVALGDETTAITTGVAKVTFRAPRAFTLTGVKASLTTVSSGAAPQFDINVNGSSILSTKLTIDASEKTSATATTPAVISSPSIAADDEITIDIDTAGTGATGAKITLVGEI